jgi:predicted metal-dependent phosphotriesterase family hydrolase
MHVQAVRGTIDPALLGFTLPAEHFYIQQWEVLGHETLYQLEDDDVFADEIAAFQAAGGRCIVDTTPPCIGRRPERLRDLSERTGINIVMSCGWYLEAYVPAEDQLERRSVQTLADHLIAEIRDGVADTGIRPGLIGEFGASKSYLSPIEERIHRASARAHRSTGIPMTTHAVRSPVGLDQLDLFEEEGADLTHVAIGHCDSFPHLSYWQAIIERGAYVQLDNIGEQMGRHEERIAGLVRDLVDRGHERQILLSHDMGVAAELRYYGGRGFTYLSEVFVPRLLEMDIPEEVIRVITVDNPARFLSMPD